MEKRVCRTLNELSGCALTGEQEAALQSVVETFFCSDDEEECLDLPQGKVTHAYNKNNE